MADNIAVKSDATTTVGTLASDDVGGFHYLKNKLVFGANDTATDVTASVGYPVAIVGTVTVGAHAVTNAGTFAVQVDGDALTALQLIDDVVYVHGTAASPGADKLLGISAKREDTPAIDINVSDGDHGCVKTNDVGAVWVAGNGTFTVSGSVSLTGNLPDTATANIAGIDTNTTDLPNVIGTDGSAGPSKAISVGGTDGSGNLQEVTMHNTLGDSLVKVLLCDSTNGVEVGGMANPLRVNAILSATDNAVLDDIAARTSDPTVGTDGAAGPTKAVSVGGTESGGNLQELRVDADGHLQVDVLSGGLAGTEYTEDAAAAADPVGGAVMLVRLDTPATITSTDGDNVAQRGTNYGAAYCQIVDSSGNFVDSFGGGTQYTTDAAAAASPVITMAGARRADTAATQADTDGDNSHLIVDASGRLWTHDPVTVALLTTIDADTSTIAGDTTSIDGKITACNTGAVVLASGTVTTVSTVTNLAQLGGTAISMNTGVRDAGTQRVTIATDDAIALSATDNAVLDDIAARTSDPTVFVDDADWTALTSSHALIGGVYQSSPGSITDGDTGPLRLNVNGAAHVAVQGTVTVDGSGVTQPVSAASLPLPTGASTSANQSTANTALSAIQTAVELIDNAISGTEMQVDVVAALPTGSNTIGKLAANSGVDIGDVDVTSQPARVATTDTITAKLATDAIHNGTTALTPKYAKIDAATSGDNTLVAAVAGKKIRVLALFCQAAGTVNIRLEDGAGGTALTGQMNNVVNTGFVLPFNPVGWFETTANTLLNMELSAAISVDGCLTYVEV